MTLTEPSGATADDRDPPVRDDATKSLRRWRYARLVLALSMLIMGICGMIYEYALGVLGNNLMGSSHEQIFVIIGLMMFAMGLGATLQQQLGRHLVDRFLWIELALGLVGGLSTIVIFAAFAYTDTYQLVMYSFALAIGLLIGCEIPLLIRINTTYQASLKANLSAILSMDYLGSLIGALLFTYVLLTRLSMERVSLMLGCVNTLLACFGLAFFWPLVRAKLRLFTACFSACTVLAIVISQVDGWMASLQQRCFEDPIVYSETTPYQHLVLTKKQDHLRMYIDGHLQFSSRDEYIYHELLVHVPMTLAPGRSKVLILGGGDGLALREVLKYGDVQQVTLVDIDPAVVQLASEQPDLIRLNCAAFHDARVNRLRPSGVEPGELIQIRAPTKRDPLVDRTEYPLADVRVLHLDADQFLRKIKDRYDVILIDFPDPRSIELAKLYSVSFYQQLARNLTDTGLVAIQSTSPRAAPLVFDCVGTTLKAANWKCLPYHAMIPSFGDWGWYLAWQTSAVAGSMRERVKEITEIPVASRYLTPAVVRAAFVFGKDVCRRAPVHANTRWRPVLVDYHARSYQ